MQTFSRFFVTILLATQLFVLGSVVTTPVLADPPPPIQYPSAQSGIFQSLSGCVDSQGVATLGCITIIMHNVVVLLMIGSAIATLFIIIIAGIRFSMSGGNPERVGQARSSITYAVVGLAIVFFSFIILKVISGITGNSDIIQSNVHFQAPVDNIAPPQATP